jgi:hypothetical protein
VIIWRSRLGRLPIRCDACHHATPGLNGKLAATRRNAPVGKGREQGHGSTQIQDLVPREESGGAAAGRTSGPSPQPCHHSAPFPPFYNTPFSFSPPPSLNPHIRPQLVNLGRVEGNDGLRTDVKLCNPVPGLRLHLPYVFCDLILILRLFAVPNWPLTQGAGPDSLIFSPWRVKKCAK